MENYQKREKQAARLKIKPHQRISPYLIECCLRASANVSYENAAEDVLRYTGMRVSGRTQQRLVHRHQFNDGECEAQVTEISLDGGKVRLRTETKGEPCRGARLQSCLHSSSVTNGMVSRKRTIGRVGESAVF